MQRRCTAFRLMFKGALLMFSSCGTVEGLMVWNFREGREKKSRNGNVRKRCFCPECISFLDGPADENTQLFSVCSLYLGVKTTKDL